MDQNSYISLHFKIRKGDRVWDEEKIGKVNKKSLNLFETLFL